MNPRIHRTVTMICNPTGLQYSNSRDTKRKTIEEEYEKRAKDIGRRIDKLYDAKKSRVLVPRPFVWVKTDRANSTKSQKVLWDRLDILNKKRQALEQTILTSMKLVENSTINISSELVAMFEGRIDELEECSGPEA